MDDRSSIPLIISNLRFYQACGLKETVITNNEQTLCGYFICNAGNTGIGVLSKPLREMGWFCNGHEDCSNTLLDETLGCSTDAPPTMHKDQREEDQREEDLREDLHKDLSHHDNVKGDKNISLSYCLKGLEEIQQLSHPCETEIFQLPPQDLYGFSTTTRITQPGGSFSCEGVFGRDYVYRSCQGRCHDADCPLGAAPRYEHCPAQYKNRVGTLAGNHFLTFLVPLSGSQLHNEFFVCNDGLKCIELSQVCDLKADCVDRSDEESCSNNFKCKHHSASVQYIPIYQRCDGVADCMDFSDENECSIECKTETVLRSKLVRFFAPTVGVVAFIANILVIPKLFLLPANRSSRSSNLTKTFTVLASIGKIMTSVSLVLLGVLAAKTEDHCSTELWRSGRLCTGIGVLGTAGTQLSLFAVTSVCTFRALRVGQRGYCVAGIVVLVVVGAFSIALIPVTGLFEDYFVQAVKFKNGLDKLLIGFSDKSRLISVINASYGRVISKELSWDVISRLINGMFIQDVDYTAEKVELNFYGNSDVCFFKYVISSSDPHRHFVWTVLGVDSFCLSLLIILHLLCFTVRHYQHRSLNKKLFNNKDRDSLKRIASLMIAADILISSLLIVYSFAIYIICPEESFNKEYATIIPLVSQSLISLFPPVMYLLWKPFLILKTHTNITSNPMSSAPSVLKSRPAQSSSESGLRVDTLSIPDSVFSSLSHPISLQKSVMELSKEQEEETSSYSDNIGFDSKGELS